MFHEKKNKPKHHEHWRLEFINCYNLSHRLPAKTKKTNSHNCTQTTFINTDFCLINTSHLTFSLLYEKFSVKDCLLPWWQSIHGQTIGPLSSSLQLTLSGRFTAVKHVLWWASTVTDTMYTGMKEVTSLATRGQQPSHNVTPCKRRSFYFKYETTADVMNNKDKVLQNEINQTMAERG